MLKQTIWVLAALAVCSLVAATSQPKKSDCINEEEEPQTNPCSWVRCGWGSTCQLSRGQPKCVCPEICTAQYQPVCGSDGKTYGNFCNMDVQNCKNKQTVVVAYMGACRDQSDDKETSSVR